MVSKVHSLLRILHNPCLSLYVKRQVILSILHPSLEYDSEVWRCTRFQSKALDAVLLAACEKILCCSSNNFSEAAWGDLGIEPLDLKRNKRKVVWFSRLLKKDKDSFYEKVFEKEWNKCKILGRKRKQWKKYVLDIISDMDLTSTSLCFKKAVSCINNAFKNFVISRLLSGMCRKSKLRVYRELKKILSVKNYLHGVSDMGSKLLFRFRSGTHGLNEELGRHSTRNSSKACFL